MIAQGATAARSHRGLAHLAESTRRAVLYPSGMRMSVRTSDPGASIEAPWKTA